MRYQEKMIHVSLFFILIFVQLVKSELTVRTESGTVQGKAVSSGKVEAYLGIPYAEPPVGNLRLTKPVPKTSWEGVYDATHMPPPCIQLSILNGSYFPDLSAMSEDCLYLNIWVPKLKRGDELKPILVFIHGGAFFIGTSSMEIYNGAKMAEYGDAVVVTINYRVGVLGFFTSFTDESPGSLGLYDQVMALQWIKKNAIHFHGDPDLITLFGESAGAFSVSLHQISPLSKHLFKRAILQSGSAVHPLYADNNEQLSKICGEYAQILGCTNDEITLERNPAEIVDCLRNLPVEKFSEVDGKFMFKYVVLYPRIGNDFLPTNTIDAYQQGQFKNSEVLMGIARDEGSLLLIFFKADLLGDKFVSQLGKKDVDLSQVLNENTAYAAIKGLLVEDDPDMGDDIIRGYLDQVNEESGYTYVNAVNEAMGDFLITCGNVFQAEYQSLRGVPVYFYMFDHRPSSTPLPEWMGVTHFDEVQYVFGNPMYSKFTEFEKELSRDMISMWVNFARTGNPNIPGKITWPRYTYQDPKYYIIGKRDKVGVRPDHYRCDRWRNRFRSVIVDAVREEL